MNEEKLNLYRVNLTGSFTSEEPLSGNGKVKKIGINSNTITSGALSNTTSFLTENNNLQQQVENASEVTPVNPAPETVGIPEYNETVPTEPAVGVTADMFAPSETNPLYDAASQFMNTESTASEFNMPKEPVASMSNQTVAPAIDSKNEMPVTPLVNEEPTVPLFENPLSATVGTEPVDTVPSVQPYVPVMEENPTVPVAQAEPQVPLLDETPVEPLNDVSAPVVEETKVENKVEDEKLNSIKQLLDEANNKLNEARLKIEELYKKESVSATVEQAQEEVKAIETVPSVQPYESSIPTVPVTPDKPQTPELNNEQVQPMGYAPNNMMDFNTFFNSRAA